VGLPVAVLALALGAVFSSLSGSAEEPNPTLSAPASAAEVVGWAAGTFDTNDQASLDPEVRRVRLISVLVPKSRLSSGAAVLYWEEASADRLERPETQRFLRFEEDASEQVRARLYALKERLVAAGKWRVPADLALFGRNDVRELSDCVVSLRKAGGRYEGQTKGKGCGAATGPVASASLEIRIWPDRMEIWDRAFDVKGQQIFGPRKGPNRFVKRSGAPPAE
jgi:hypothetical protein